MLWHVLRDNQVNGDNSFECQRGMVWAHPKLSHRNFPLVGELGDLEDDRGLDVGDASEPTDGVSHEAEKMFLV